MQNIDRFSVHLLLMCAVYSFHLSSYYIQGLFVSCHQYSKHRNIMSYVNGCNTNKFQPKYQFRRRLERFSGIVNCTPKVLLISEGDDKRSHSLQLCDLTLVQRIVSTVLVISMASRSVVK